MVFKGKGDKPPNEPLGAPAAAARFDNHQPQGSNTKLAPTMRAQAMSSGSKWREADARAMTMKVDQMPTVMTAASKPTVRGDSRRRRWRRSCIQALSVGGALQGFIIRA